MKDMVCAHKVITREELLQRILSAARSTYNAAVLRKVTSSLVTPVRKCIQADGGHFVQSENASKQTEDTSYNLLEC